MRSGRVAGVAAVLACLLFAGAGAEALDARALEGAFVDAVAKVRPAVVHIRVTKVGQAVGYRDPFDEFFFGPRRPPQPQEGLGSGVIISPDGLIMTNHHVVGDASRIEVRLADDRVYQAKLVGTDPQTDIAVVRIGGENHPTAKFADSDGIRVGQWALAIGNPFGLDHTVTLGIISARGRRGIVGSEGYEDFIQTDAAVNPGNSGGPLVNIDGEVVGINTVIFSRSGGNQGIGFAVPANMAKMILDRLVADGRVTRSWLGVVIQDVTPDLAPLLKLEKAEGVVVTQVVPGSPAGEAGLAAGDVILAIDGKALADANDLRNRVAHTRVGTEVTVLTRRGSRNRTVRAKLTEHPNEQVSAPRRHEERSESADAGRLGLALQPLTPELARRMGYRESGGLLVVRVQAGSASEGAGLQAGNVILEVNGRKMASLDDFAAVWKARKAGEPLLLLVGDAPGGASSGGNRFVVLRPE